MRCLEHDARDNREYRDQALHYKHEVEAVKKDRNFLMDEVEWLEKEVSKQRKAELTLKRANYSINIEINMALEERKSMHAQFQEKRR